MKLIWKIVVLAVLAATSAFAAEKAVLRNGFEIRHEAREEIGASTRLYVNADHSAGYVDVPTAEISAFERDDSPPPVAAETAAPEMAKPAPKLVNIPELVNSASDAQMVDADLIASVIRAESSFNPKALSPKGAQGLMQLMPDTAGKLGVKDAFDPRDNIEAGTRYLRELLLKYNGNIAKALAAYNAGTHRVEQYNGVPPYRETHAYVVKIIKDFNRKKRTAKATVRKQAASTRQASASGQ